MNGLCGTEIHMHLADIGNKKLRNFLFQLSLVSRCIKQLGQSYKFSSGLGLCLHFHLNFNKEKFRECILFHFKV